MPIRVSSSLSNEPYQSPSLHHFRVRSEETRNIGNAARGGDNQESRESLNAGTNFVMK
jgi:hypothetical protein